MKRHCCVSYLEGSFGSNLLFFEKISKKKHPRGWSYHDGHYIKFDSRSNIKIDYNEHLSLEWIRNIYEWKEFIDED